VKVLLDEEAEAGGCGGVLDKINPNFKRFQIINHLRNYFKKITSFCIAIHGGDAEACASPGGVAKRWQCVATQSGEAGKRASP
jgi:hypothetical protein